MRAITACLLLALAVPLAAHAGGVRLSAADACPEKPAAKAVRAKAASTPPVRDAKPRPSVHGDADTGPRQPGSPRWHSFLPGMIR